MLQLPAALLSLPPPPKGPPRDPASAVIPAKPPAMSGTYCGPVGARSGISTAGSATASGTGAWPGGNVRTLRAVLRVPCRGTCVEVACTLLPGARVGDLVASTSTLG